jgi:hypothetical protein
MSSPPATVSIILSDTRVGSIVSDEVQRQHEELICQKFTYNLQRGEIHFPSDVIVHLQGGELRILSWRTMLSDANVRNVENYSVRSPGQPQPCRTILSDVQVCLHHAELFSYSRCPEAEFMNVPIR